VKNERSPSVNKDLGFEEYKSLRKELQQLAASISRWQMVGFISAGAAAAVVWILSVDKAFLFSGISYAALLVIAGCIVGIIHDLQSILRIAAYIQAFHEGEQTGALWETRLEKARCADIFAPLRGWMTPIPSLWWAGLICAAVPFIKFVSAGWIMKFVPDARFAPYMDYMQAAYVENRLYAYMLITIGVWLIFWLMISRSYRAFGNFKNDTLAAFEQIAAGERGEVGE